MTILKELKILSGNDKIKINSYGKDINKIYFMDEYGKIIDFNQNSKRIYIYITPRSLPNDRFYEYKISKAPLKKFEIVGTFYLKNNIRGWVFRKYVSDIEIKDKSLIIKLKSTFKVKYNGLLYLSKILDKIKNKKIIFAKNINKIVIRKGNRIIDQLEPVNKKNKIPYVVLILSNYKSLIVPTETYFHEYWMLSFLTNMNIDIKKIIGSIFIEPNNKVYGIFDKNYLKKYEISHRILNFYLYCA